MGLGQKILRDAEITQYDKFHAGKLGQELKHRVQVVKGIWDFADQGGAVGTGDLKDDDGNVIKLPAGVIIRQVYTREVTNVTTSAAGTLAFDSEASGDLLTDTAAATFSGIQAGEPVGTAATMVRLTAERTLGYEIKTGALTAGKVEVFVELVNL